MFISLETIFSFINFGVLAVIAYYLYDKYGKELLFTVMRSSTESKHLLELEERALRDEQTRLQEGQQEQERMRSMLLLKVAKWRTAYDQECKEAQKETQEVKLVLNKKIERQKQWYGEQHAIKSALPEIITQVRNTLSQELKEPTKQDAYIEDIIAYMKKQHP